MLAIKQIRKNVAIKDIKQRDETDKNTIQKAKEVNVDSKETGKNIKLQYLLYMIGNGCK